VVGDLLRVTALARARLLATKLASSTYLAPPTSPGNSPPPQLRLGFVDRCLDATERASSAISSVIAAPLTLLTWPFSSPATPAAPPENDLDFHVLHTNWYWRSLHRIFRLSDRTLLRVHPVHLDVRASHPFSTLACFHFVDDSNAILS
jgi:hypothetical protein